MRRDALEQCPGLGLILRLGALDEGDGTAERNPAAGEDRRDALVQILTEPRNALVKQYQKIFDFENVSLEFSEDGLEAIAEEAIKRSAGARGLRAILEEVLLDVMYELPGRDDIGTVQIDEGVVLRNVPPRLLPRADTDAQSRRAS